MSTLQEVRKEVHVLSVCQDEQEFVCVFMDIFLGLQIYTFASAVHCVLLVSVCVAGSYTFIARRGVTRQL